MSPIYKAARAAYKAGQFSNFELRGDDLGDYVSVYREGKFLAVFVSREAAKKAIAEQTEKASKFIQ